MENASEALYMAATILIGMIIVSLFAALFYSFSTSGVKIEAKLAETQLKEFNAKYEVFRDSNQFVNEGNTQTEYNALVSIYDIISLINFTDKTNHENYSNDDIINFGTTENSNSMPYYVSVYINGTDNLKNRVKDSEAKTLINNYNNKPIEKATRAELDKIMKNCYYDLNHNTSPDENCDYVFRFKCTHIEYSPKTGRVVQIHFKFVKPNWTTN